METQIKWIVQKEAIHLKEFINFLENRSGNIEYSIPESIDLNEQRVVLGSIEFVTTYNKMYGEYENSKQLFNLDLYKTTNYYKYLSGRLWNENCFWVPFWKLKQDVTNYFQMFQTNRLFIRPDDGAKTFTGTTIGEKWARKELEIIRNLDSSKNLKDDTLVLVAPKSMVIGPEIRALIGPNELVSFSFYNEPEHKCNVNYEKISKEVVKYVDQINLSKIKVDPFYTMDLAISENTFKIIELNSFNCAGLYNMDYELVYRAIVKYIKYG